MKRWMLFAGVPLALGFVSSGCGSGEPTPSRSDGGSPSADAGSDCFVDESCGSCMTSTFLPSKGEGDVLVVCSECNGDKCLGLGDACVQYGDQCDFDGSPGLCVACCTGADARLRCAAL